MAREADAHRARPTLVECPFDQPLEARVDLGILGVWSSFLLSDVVETAIIVIAALVISAIVRAFLVQAFYVPSGSMENTLLISDRIIASKITTSLSGVQRGEIVVFKDPGGWLPEPPPPELGT